MAICSCPAATSIPSVPNASGCVQDFSQCAKIVFQRIFSSGTTKNSFTSTSAIGTLASWTAKFSATDGGKMVITPFIEAPASDGGDAITFGGGNDTLGGVTKIIGRNPVNFSCVLRQTDQSIVKALKGLMCEGALGVYLINNEGAILAEQDETTATTYYPIPIQSLFVGDLMLMGLDNPDENTLSFSFKPNWSDNVKIVVPSFDPLTDLENDD